MLCRMDNTIVIQYTRLFFELRPGDDLERPLLLNAAFHLESCPILAAMTS